MLNYNIYIFIYPAFIKHIFIYSIIKYTQPLYIQNIHIIYRVLHIKQV